jgi:hypothetical protein
MNIWWLELLLYLESIVFVSLYKVEINVVKKEIGFLFFIKICILMNCVQVL